MTCRHCLHGRTIADPSEPRLYFTSESPDDGHSWPWCWQLRSAELAKCTDRVIETSGYELRECA